MQSILTQSPQIPDRTAAVQRAIGQVPLAERFQRAPQTRVNATTNKHSDRVDLREALGEDPLTDQEHRQLRHLLELASRITGAVVQPGDISSGGPMFNDNSGDLFGPGIGSGPPPPPTSTADATAVPNADFQAQAETGTGHGGQVPPPEPGGSGSGGGLFNPEIQIDTSTTSTSGPTVTQP